MQTLNLPREAPVPLAIHQVMSKKGQKSGAAAQFLEAPGAAQVKTAGEKNASPDVQLKG